MSERDELEVEALVTDRYLESLLAARDRRNAAHPSDQGVDRGVAVTARALEEGLTRVHPSFRFEERLAGDLQAAAARSRRGGRVARPGAIRRLEPRTSAGRSTAPTPAGAAAKPVARPLLIGGALTSAALSLAGAYVAWRRGRPPLDPMVRAVRAAHRQGLAHRLAPRARPTAPGGRER
jgi:hypothetical protein